MLDRLEGDHLWSAVRQLSAVQRQAIELAFGHGLSHQEVADMTGVPLGTAKSRVRLGLAHLRTGLTRLRVPHRPEDRRGHQADGRS